MSSSREKRERLEILCKKRRSAGESKLKGKDRGVGELRLGQLAGNVGETICFELLAKKNTPEICTR